MCLKYETVTSLAVADANVTLSLLYSLFTDMKGEAIIVRIKDQGLDFVAAVGTDNTLARRPPSLPRPM